jgi:hypothetical protein
MAVRSKSRLFWISRSVFGIGLVLLVLSERASGSTREVLQGAGLAIIVLGFAIFLVSWRRARAPLLQRRTSRTGPT